MDLALEIEEDRLQAHSKPALALVQDDLNRRLVHLLLSDIRLAILAIAFWPSVPAFWDILADKGACRRFLAEECAGIGLSC